MKKIVSLLLAALLMVSVLCISVAGIETSQEIGDSEVIDWNDICSKTKDGKHVNPSEYLRDEDSHWLICEECGEINAFASHAFNESGKCKVCGYQNFVPGDLDGKEGVNADDAIYLLYHVFFPADYPVNQSVDFDGKNGVNADDAIYLLYHVFFPADYPLN